MVMLVETGAGNEWTRQFKISQSDGILIPIWSGECNKAEKECQTYSFEQLKKAARGYDLGKIKVEVKVDNIPIAKLDVVDYTTNIIENVSEEYTKEFNAGYLSICNSHVKRLERDDALEGIHSLPMQKIFTKRDAEYSKKVSATTVSRRKISKIFKFYGVYIML